GGLGVSPERDKGLGRDAQATDEDKTTQGESLDHEWPIPEEKLRRKLAIPSQGRLYYIRDAMKMGWSIERINELTRIDPWFLAQMQQLVEMEDRLFEAAAKVKSGWSSEIVDLVREAKLWGYSDVQLAHVWEMKPADFRKKRIDVMKPVYKLVDT